MGICKVAYVVLDSPLLARVCYKIRLRLHCKRRDYSVRFGSVLKRCAGERDEGDNSDNACLDVRLINPH